jgi:hypothetical protein
MFTKMKNAKLTDKERKKIDGVYNDMKTRCYYCRSLLINGTCQDKMCITNSKLEVTSDSQKTT